MTGVISVMESDREREAVDAALAGRGTRLHDIILRRARTNPDAPALVEDDCIVSFAALAAMIELIAASLRGHGVRPGDRVMIIGENSVALVALLFAVSALDAWAVLVNSRLSAREIDTVQAHSGARCTVYLTRESPEAAGHAARHRAEPFDLGAAGVARISPLNEEAVPEPVSEDRDAQVAALIYTSGTTGNPKGVMLTHGNLLFIAALSSVLRHVSPGDRVYGVLPISHVYGLTSVCLGSLFGGACVVLEARYTPQKMAMALSDDAITVCQGVPAMYAKLLAMLNERGTVLKAPGLRFMYAGGSPLDPALKRDVEEYFHLPLHNGYGLTEAAPTISATRQEAPRADCSVGPILPYEEVRIVGADGNDVAAGDAGELWVRGPNVMKGYYRNPAMTAAVINADGWLNTGDLARMEADGALFIVGRTKELIIRSGFNVYPVEVEAVLNSHPDVTQSAVVGREVEGNEEVVVFVERAPGAAIDEAGLLGFAAESLAPYKRPAQIIFMSPLPAAANGKVLKHKLKEMLDSFVLQ